MRRSPAFWLAAALSVLSAGPATAIDGDPAPLLLAQASEVEITFWESVKDSTDPAEFQAYIDAFPEGRFVALARICLKKLKTAETEADAGDKDGGSAGPSAEERVSSAEPDPAREPRLFAPVEKTIAVTLGSIDNRGFRTQLGVNLAEVSDELAALLGVTAGQGAVVALVHGGTAAAAVGLKTGDVLLSLDGETASDLRGFVHLVQKRRPGDGVTLRYLEVAPDADTFLTRLKDLAESRKDPDLLMLHAQFVPYDKRFDHYRKAAELGSARGMAMLGEAYYQGSGVPKDRAKALPWLRKAAELGDGTAMFWLGFAYWSGEDVTKDQRQAVQWMRRAAEAGSGSALGSLGSYYDARDTGFQDPEESFYWTRRSALAGSDWDAHRLGDKYARGNGVEADRSEALIWFRRAAEHGFSASLVEIGRQYATDPGRNDALAMAWYEAAASRGVADGAFELAKLYDTGRIVAKDPERAGAQLFDAFSMQFKGFHKFTLFWVKQMQPETRRALQRRLKQAGVYDGPIDGDLGPKSEEALDEIASTAKAKPGGPLPLPELPEYVPVSDSAATTAEPAKREDDPLSELEKLD